MDRAIEEIIALLKVSLAPRGIKQFYNGRPNGIPKSSFPAVVVKGGGISSEILDIRRNQEVYRVKIFVLHDERDVINSDKNEYTAERVVRKIFEERTGTNEVRPDTILGTIEQQFLYKDTFTINIKVGDIRFGDEAEGEIGIDFAGFAGVMDLEIMAEPHSVRTV